MLKSICCSIALSFSLVTHFSFIIKRKLWWKREYVNPLKPRLNRISLPKATKFHDTKSEQMGWLRGRRLGCNSWATAVQTQRLSQRLPPSMKYQIWQHPKFAGASWIFFIFLHLQHMTWSSPLKGIKLFNLPSFKPEKHILQVLSMFLAMVVHK